MPPKRKPAATAPATRRATRVGGLEAETAPATRKRKTPSTAAVSSDEDSDEVASRPAAKTRKTKKGGATTKAAPAKKGAKPAASNYPPGLDPTSYTQQRLLNFFLEYADPESAADAREISPEGLEKLCTAASMPMEAAQPLLLAWITQAAKMGSISITEWAQLAVLQTETPEKLGLAMSDLEALFFKNGSIPPLNPKVPETYNRRSLRDHQLRKEAAFTEFYLYCHALAKAEEQRNIDMETAAALWTVLLVPKYPIASELVEFVTDKPQYKGVTKDLWAMTLEFFKAVGDDLSDYDENEAWPSMLDDFVAHTKRGAAAAADTEMA